MASFPYILKSNIFSVPPRRRLIKFCYLVLLKENWSPANSTRHSKILVNLYLITFTSLYKLLIDIKHLFDFEYLEIIIVFLF